jgi:hypothetical protein
LADELDDAFGVINLLTQQRAQVPAFCAENVLPDWLIAKKSQGVSHQLPGAAKFPTNGRNEN